MSLGKLAGELNPDSDISVAVCYKDGKVSVFAALKKGKRHRAYLYSRTFSTYGDATLWAAEFEANNRKQRMKEKE